MSTDELRAQALDRIRPAAHTWIAFWRRPPTEAEVRREIDRIERRP
jgi:hypothetical protein